jgi:flagella synthesis protein FlgN
MPGSPTSTLNEELTLITALTGLMQQEQECLVAANADELNALTPHKAHLVAQMAELARQRHAHLAGCGFEAGEAGMEAWLASAERADTALWQELLAQTRTAKELNRVNGMLINKQMTHNQSIMNAMRTPAGGAQTTIYDPSGQSKTTGPSRRFVIG